MILSTSATRIINDILQGELAAIETYQQSLAQIGQERRAIDLRRLLAEHQDAAATLKNFTIDLGGEASQTSQTWGVFAKAVEGAAKLLGRTAAIYALKTPEEHGASTYSEALTNEHLPADLIEYLRTCLLPSTQSHVAVLYRFLRVEF